MREVPRLHPVHIEALSALPVRAVVPPDLHEIRLFEGLEPDSWESRPAPWWTCPASTECPQLADVDGLDRVPRRV